METTALEVDAEDNCCWTSYFTQKHTDFYGYCETIEQAADLVQSFSYETSTSYIVLRATQKFGNGTIANGMK